MGKKGYQIIVLILALVTLTGVVLTGVIYTDRQNFEQTVVVDTNGVTQQNLSFSPPKIFPGETSVCKINLASRASGDFKILLDYVGLEGGTLNEFVRVAVCCEEWSDEYALSDLVAGKKVEFVTKCVAGQQKTVTLSYFIPSSVGNEAQGKEAKFDVFLTMSLE